MEIESFSINNHLVEVIYHQPPADDNTLLQATPQLLDDHCSRTYSYTVCCEYYNHQKDLLEQQTFSADMPTWFNSLSDKERNDVARQFVQYCQNLDLSKHPISFHY